MYVGYNILQPKYNTCTSIKFKRFQHIFNNKKQNTWTSGILPISHFGFLLALQRMACNLYTTGVVGVLDGCNRAE